MSITDNTQAGAISFAHLAGITSPVRAAKADAPSDDTDDEKKDAKKAEDDTDDEQADSDTPDKQDDDGGDKKDAKRADADEPDEDDTSDDDKKSKKASGRSGVARGVAQERARWVAVVGSRAFARNPAVGAHLLANTPMNASAILGVLRDAPATSSVDAGRSARNPNLGAAAPAVAPSTDARWGAAFKRAGIG